MLNSLFTREPEGEGARYTRLLNACGRFRVDPVTQQNVPINKENGAFFISDIFFAGAGGPRLPRPAELDVDDVAFFYGRKLFADVTDVFLHPRRRERKTQSNRIGHQIEWHTSEAISVIKANVNIRPQGYNIATPAHSTSTQRQIEAANDNEPSGRVGGRERHLQCERRAPQPPTEYRSHGKRHG